MLFSATSLAVSVADVLSRLRTEENAGALIGFIQTLPPSLVKEPIARKALMFAAMDSAYNKKLTISERREVGSAVAEYMAEHAPLTAESFAAAGMSAKASQRLREEAKKDPRAFKAVLVEALRKPNPRDVPQADQLEQMLHFVRKAFFGDSEAEREQVAELRSAVIGDEFKGALRDYAKKFPKVGGNGDGDGCWVQVLNALCNTGYQDPQLVSMLVEQVLAVEKTDGKNPDFDALIAYAESLDPSNKEIRKRMVRISHEAEQGNGEKPLTQGLAQMKRLEKYISLDPERQLQLFQMALDDTYDRIKVDGVKRKAVRSTAGDLVLIMQMMDPKSRVEALRMVMRKLRANKGKPMRALFTDVIDLVYVGRSLLTGDQGPLVPKEVLMASPTCVRALIRLGHF